MWKLFAIARTVLIVQLSACSVQYPRPQDWPETAVSTSGCPDISGTYYNGPEEVTGTIDAFLFDELSREGIWGTHECHHCPVSILWADEMQRVKLIVTLTDDYGEIHSVELKKSDGDFMCEEGKLFMDYRLGFEMLFEGMLVVGTRVFEKAVDGSLTRADTHDGYAHTWIYIPIILQDIEEHARWAPYGAKWQH